MKINIFELWFMQKKRKLCFKTHVAHLSCGGGDGSST